jgi:hypothetical protein
MHSAPFWRTVDKLGFVIGTFIIFSYAYMLGQYPHTYFYNFYTALIVSLLFIRFFHFYTAGWMFFLIDFCYYANTLVLICITNGKGQDDLFRVAFLFSSGVLGFSVKMFRNSLVFHRIDFLTSLGIHLCPHLCMYHFKWFTLNHEASLNESERNFVSPAEPDHYFHSMVIVPIVAYLCWSFNYALINFVFLKRKIAKNDFASLYKQFKHDKAM